MSVFHPLNSVLLVEPDEPINFTTLELPDTVKDREKAESGVVVEAGPDAPKWVKPGMHVSFVSGVSEVVRIDKVDHYLLSPMDLRGSIEEDAHDGTPG